ncbi:pyridoxamine 5'-phosphate oxidase family protein [Streptomyces phaeoluteigriseus]|uniref:pyridoxamine 5'-phosphate oxidase family protein n=1 Tax=Streptomyces phaeoluteigriseus TaxID=114686 RepID=UPI0026A1E2AE
MEIIEPLRGPRQRRADVLDRLEREIDIWVATAGPDGVPCLVALWFVWDGECLWLSTRLTNPTGRNLRDGGRPGWRSGTRGTWC